MAEVRDKEANLKLAIAAYEDALRVRTFDAFPQGYATTQNNLAVAYAGLAEVCDKEANLNRAIAGFRQALRGFTFEALPEDYARTQGNLARVSIELARVRLEGGAVEEGKDLLRAARHNCAEALRVYIQESHPEEHKRLSDLLAKLDAWLAEIS